MNVKITIASPSGEFESVIIEGITDESDERISEHVRDLADTTTWAVGDILTIKKSLI